VGTTVGGDAAPPRMHRTPAKTWNGTTPRSIRRCACEQRDGHPSALGALDGRSQWTASTQDLDSGVEPADLDRFEEPIARVRLDETERRAAVDVAQRGLLAGTYDTLAGARDLMRLAGEAGTVITVANRPARPVPWALRRRAAWRAACCRRRSHARRPSPTSRHRDSNRVRRLRPGPAAALLAGLAQELEMGRRLSRQPEQQVT